MSCYYVWVTGLQCTVGHDLDPQSKERTDYKGYPKEAVPVEVAADLRRAALGL